MKVVLHYPTFSEMVGGILKATCPCWFLLGGAWPCLVLGVAHVGCATFFSSIKVSSAWTLSLSFTRAPLRTREYLQNTRDTGISVCPAATALHTQLSGEFFKVLAGPLCLDQPWTHIFFGVSSPPPGTPEKSHLNTWISHSKEGYFCHHSSFWLCRESNSCTYISTYSVEQRVTCFQGTQHLFSPCSL